MRHPGIVHSSSPARAIAFVAVALQFVHFFALLVLTHASVASDLIQLLLPLLVAVGCLYKRYSSRDTRDRRAWALLAIAFGLWSIAEVCYLVESHYLSAGDAFSSVDDVLWLLFAIPLLLVVSGSLEGSLNWVSWMDQSQAFIFFLVVLVLVYLRPSVLSFDRAYSIQNVALLLSCSLRYTAAETDHSRRFFGRFAIYLTAYCLCSGIGNALAHRGWPPGSMVDLFWTLPLTLFCVAVLTIQTDSRSDARQEKAVTGDLTTYLHDLSAFGLAALSMGSSVYLALHWTLPGSVCLACSFTLFAIRTCGRERQLHRANDRLHASVLEDALTGLGNRACLRKHLTHLLSPTGARSTSGQTVAVMFVDLDRFKAINDGLGHDVGDKVLVEVAERIKTACQNTGVACRLGGDEFVVVFEGELAVRAQQVATELLASIRAPLWLDEKVLQLSGSIGVAITRGDDEPNDLLRKADHAMYRAKKLGKNRVEVADSSFTASSHPDYMLEAELGKALVQGEISVYLQPIFSLQSHDVSGFEALARWSHPKLGMIPPSEFIPLAEETGMILELGRQVLTRACREVARWNATWNTRLPVSVNVSARQLSDPNLLSSFLDILAREGLAPDLLRLEITESVLLVGEAYAAKVLSEAQRQGMEISLDDFGTGFSSLSHLLNIPTDEIKIDRSFVRGLHQDSRRAELVRTVLQLGHSLKKRVVAEGVELQEELQVLQGMGCKYIQGYLLAKPFPIESLALQPLCAPISTAVVSQRHVSKVV